MTTTKSRWFIRAKQNGDVRTATLMLIALVAAGCGRSGPKATERCDWLVQQGVAENCRPDKSTSFYRESVEFTIKRDHTTWGAITVWRSQEEYLKEAAEIESGRGLRGQNNVLSRSTKTLVTTRGTLNDADDAVIRDMMAFDQPKAD